MKQRINTGLLFLRLGIGFAFVVHGWPKLTGGTQSWQHLGAAMQHFGITFFPMLWGFMAMVSEFFGGLCLIAGLLIKPVSALLLFTMFVAAISNLSLGYGLEGVIEQTEISGALVLLLFTGGGEYAIPNLLTLHKMHDRSA